MSDAPPAPTRLPLRVLVKGASTAVYTSWMSGSRADFAWPRVVELELYAAGHVAEVRCHAVPAEPLRFALRTWEREVLAWSPDVVVLQYGHLETIHLFLPRWLERHANSLRGRPLPVRRFYRTRLLKPAWKLLTRVQRLVDSLLPPDLLAFKPKRAKGDLRQFIQHVRTVASPLVLIAEIPPSGAPYRKWFPGSAQRIDTMNRALREVVAEFDEPDVRFIAVNEVTTALLAPGEDALPDGGHYTPELHRAVGERLAEEIIGWAEKQDHLDVPERSRPTTA